MKLPNLLLVRQLLECQLEHVTEHPLHHRQFHDPPVPLHLQRDSDLIGIFHK